MFFSIGLLCLGTLVAFQNRAAQTALRERTRSSGTVILESIAELCREHLPKNDIKGLETDLRPLSTLSRIAFIEVDAPSGRALIRVENPAHRGQKFKYSGTQTENGNLIMGARVYSDDRLLGQLKVGIWVGGIFKETAQIRKNSMLLGLILCLFLAVGSYLLGQGLARRLERFTKDVKTRPSDDYAHFDITGNDEITDLARAFNKRQDNAKEAEAARDVAEKKRQDMVNMVIHDLKGPLAGLQNGLDVCEESAGSAEARDLLRLMKKSNNRILRMVDEILQIARLEEPAFRLDEKQIDLAQLAQQRIEESMLTAQTRGITIEFNGLDQPCPVKADPILLGRVIDNLLFNAFEHSPNGHPINVTVRSDAEGARFEIRDHGPGLLPDDLKVIFEKFQKGHAVSKGFGLGLAFCRLAVERHGGRIWAENIPSGGACFFFTIPGR